jgi:L-lactate dehydrogenase complex protein LldG
MSSRALILGRVRRNEPAAVPLPDVPLFARSQATSPVAAFAAALARMGGVFVEPPAGAALDPWIRARFAAARVVCSATPEVTGTLSIEAVQDPRDLHDVDVGVVRAAFGVAETGSVWLSEAEFGLNALGFLAQHLVVLLDPDAIVENLHHAYREPGFRTARYAVLMTGPSATADIEGVLILGAQGIRTLTVVAAPANPKAPRRGVAMTQITRLSTDIHQGSPPGASHTERQGHTP